MDRLRVVGKEVGALWLFGVAGCVIVDHDTNRPAGYEELAAFDAAFGQVKKDKSWEEAEQILNLSFEDSDNIEIRTGPDAIRGLFESQVDIFRGVFDTPEKLEAFFVKAKPYRLVVIPWRDVVRTHDRIYFSRQEFAEKGIDNRYLILFKKEDGRFKVEHLQPARKAIDKYRDREAFALLLTDLLGFPTVTPDPPDVNIPGLKIRP